MVPQACKNSKIIIHLKIERHFYQTQPIFQLRPLKKGTFVSVLHIKCLMNLIWIISPKGYVGLLLGVAIFHFADLVNMFLDRRIVRYQKILDDDQKDEEEDGSELYQVIKNDDSVTS